LQFVNRNGYLFYKSQRQAFCDLQDQLCHLVNNKNDSEKCT